MKKNFRLGFTVIEVTLVLSIAGLIFIMLFVALPGLRASQRDAERRSDIANFIEEVKNYQENNRGALPGGSGSNSSIIVTNSTGGSDNSWGGFYKNYLKSFNDPSGYPYRLEIVNCNASGGNCRSKNSLEDISFPNNYTILVVRQAQCEGPIAKPTKNTRKIAVIYKLEGAGSYCSNS